MNAAEHRNSEFELRWQPQSFEDAHNRPESTLSQELKPADRGRHAWTVLIAGVVFEALFWG